MPKKSPKQLAALHKLATYHGCHKKSKPKVVTPESYIVKKAVEAARSAPTPFRQSAAELAFADLLKTMFK